MMINPPEQHKDAFEAWYAKTGARIWNNYDACCSAFIAGRAYAATLRQPDSGRVGDAVPNDDAGIEWVRKHHLFVYEVDFGDEGKGRYIRLADFNKVVAKLEAALAGQGQGEAVGVIEGIDDETNTVTVDWSGPISCGDELFTRPAPAASRRQDDGSIADSVKGWTVSIDVSTGDHDAEHRIFGRVIGYNGDRILLAEMTEDNAAAASPAASPAGVLDGYVLVPREPTDVMAYAALNDNECHRPEDSELECMKQQYRAMLAAAPSAPEGDGGAE